MMNVVGQPDTVVVLGGGSDIGTAIAHRFAEIGAHQIVLAGPHQSTLEISADKLEGLAPHVATEEFDATMTSTHADFFSTLTERYGDLDIVILAFGVLPDQQPLLDDPTIAVDAAQVNYVGALSAMLTAANVLRRQGHGTIVLLSSVAGQRPRPMNFVYGSMKAGIDAAAEGLGYSLQGSGVNVLTVRPGFVYSKMTTTHKPAPFAATPRDVAIATVDATAKRKTVVWVPAKLKFVVSGIRHIPRTAMKRITR